MDSQYVAPPGDESVDDLDEISEVLPVQFSITSYGADYPIDGLVKRVINGDIVIPLFSLEPADGQTVTGFQREFVWKKSQADRFIESLLLGLPVPSIFLVKEPNGKYLVLDGQQRLKSLESFYKGVFKGVEFLLEEVQECWVGKSYLTLNPEDRRRLDNSIMHAIVVRQDEPTQEQNSIYMIFERLNSGGTILQPQEIRVALYRGQFAAVLSRLNEMPEWRILYGKKSSRLKDIELILRFFALYFYSAKYQKPMKNFLNTYMANNRELSKQDESTIKPLFENAIKTILEIIGQKAFRPFGVSLNAAVVDSIMFGVAHRLSRGPITDVKGLKRSYDLLVANPEYVTAITRFTAYDESVTNRLKLAKEAFEGIA